MVQNARFSHCRIASRNHGPYFPKPPSTGTGTGGMVGAGLCAGAHLALCCRSPGLRSMPVCTHHPAARLDLPVLRCLFCLVRLATPSTGLASRCNCGAFPVCIWGGLIGPPAPWLSGESWARRRSAPRLDHECQAPGHCGPGVGSARRPRRRVGAPATPPRVNPF